VLSPLCEGIFLDGTPYVVVRLLGQGGMGEVYEVEHHVLGRRFAVKVLHRAHRGRCDLAARMRMEARTLAALRHQNLVEVYDLGATADGRPYFAMELLHGRDLRRELRRFGVIAVPCALHVMAQVLDGLEASHRAGIVHRDIKLENIFLCDDGAIKLLDFGIAKTLGPGSSRTAHGSVVGTVRSMAPEQHASGDADPRTDIYAAGLSLYELVAGRGPFDEVQGNDHAMRFAHCERPPPRPSLVSPQAIPQAVEGVILRALAKRPDARFASAGEMAEALRSLSSAAARAVPADIASPASVAGAFLREPTTPLPESRPPLLSAIGDAAAAMGSALHRIFPIRAYAGGALERAKPHWV
jgi:eukaryotic-like serine/threonine-protein kinase